MSALNRRRRLGVALALGAATVYGFTTAGRYLAAPAQTPAVADLIVALGGDHSARSRKAAELYKKGFAPKVMLAGMEAPTDQTNHRARLIINEGVPATALIFDGLSENSWDEAVNTLSVMRARGMSTVLVVSDPPHMRRLNWAWGKVFADSGMTFRPVACDAAEWNASRWWSRKKFRFFVINEYLKLAYYRVIH